MNAKLINNLYLVILGWGLIYGQNHQSTIPDDSRNLSNKLIDETNRSLKEYNYYLKPTEVQPEFNPLLLNLVQNIASQIGIIAPITMFYHFDKPNAGASESIINELAIDPRLITRGGENAYAYIKFIIAHEMAHLHYGHCSLKKKRDDAALIKLFATMPVISVGKLLSKLVFCNNKSPLVTATLLTSYGIINGYQAFSDARTSKNEEIEADLKALEITKDPKSAINVIEDLRARQASTKLLPKQLETIVKLVNYLFADHPTYNERIAYLSATFHKSDK